MTTAGERVARLEHMDRSAVRKIAAVMGFVAVTLFIASALHLLDNSFHAGIPEVIIGVVLATGAAVMVQEPWRARALGLGAVGFAIVGFGVGLRMTSQGGHVGEIAYHVVVLPILIGAFVALLRAAPARQSSMSR